MSSGTLGKGHSFSEYETSLRESQAVEEEVPRVPYQYEFHLPVPNWLESCLREEGDDMRVRAKLEEGTQVYLLRYLKCPRAGIRAYV